MENLRCLFVCVSEKVRKPEMCVSEKDGEPEILVCVFLCTYPCLLYLERLTPSPLPRLQDQSQREAGVPRRRRR